MLLENLLGPAQYASALADRHGGALELGRGRQHDEGMAAAADAREGGGERRVVAHAEIAQGRASPGATPTMRSRSTAATATPWNIR